MTREEAIKNIQEHCYFANLRLVKVSQGFSQGLVKEVQDEKRNNI